MDTVFTVILCGLIYYFAPVAKAYLEMRLGLPQSSAQPTLPKPPVTATRGTNGMPDGKAKQLVSTLKN